MPDSQRPHGLQPTRVLCPWDFPGKSTGVGCHCLLQVHSVARSQTLLKQLSSSSSKMYVINKMGHRRRQWQPTPVLLPGKSQGRRSLAGCSPRGREEWNTTEQLHFQFSLSCIGEGNGNPLQCSCMETPRDGGAWWAAVYGVAQSWT